MSEAKITWPGIDKQRAGHALAHLRAALIATINSRNASEAPWTPTRAAYLTRATRHVIDARGYLGAIGFEKKGKSLVRRDA